MIPARDRKLRLTIYNTQANMEADTNGTVIESGIYESSARLEHTFFTALPGWGEANASMFTCELADAPDLAGKYIRVRVLGYATEAATSRTTYRVFAGKIDSCRYDKYKASRTLEAYDRLYELRKVDISEWWNTWVQTLTADTVTLPSVLAAMCTQYGVTNSASLPAYSTGTAPLKARKLGACSFVQMLGYIGEICGGYFSMQDGPLRFVDMRNVNGATAQESVEGNLDTELTEIADGDTGIYTQVTIYEGSDIVYSQGSGKNLAITDNPFLVGQTPATINSWGVNIYANATRMSGWPATLALVYSQPQSAWSRITSSSPFILTTTDEGTTRRHIVSGYSFSGPGLIDETISCTGEMREGASYSAAQNAMLSELTDLGTQLTFKVNADAVIEAVNLEAQGGVTINAEAIDINGVVSANNGFKINTDGSMETIAGKIGDLAISSNGISAAGANGELSIGNDGKITVTRPSEGSVLSLSNGSLSITTEGEYDTNYYYYELTLNRKEDLSSGYTNHSTRLNAEQIHVRRTKYTAGGAFVEERSTLLTQTSLQIQRDNNVKAMYTGTGAFILNAAGTANVSELSENTLKVNTHDLLRMAPHFAQMFATAIASGENLNSTTYLAPGQYYTPTSAIAASLTNSPTSTAFKMTVEAPISAAYDNESASGEAFRIRRITVLGSEEWMQYCYKTSTTWTYGPWLRFALGVTKDTYTNTSVKAGSLTARRNGNVVAIISTGNAVSVPAGSWKTYVTLAAQYRPSEEINAPVTNAYGDVKTVRIRTNGNVDLYSATAITSASNFSFNVTYIVD